MPTIPTRDTPEEQGQLERGGAWPMSSLPRTLVSGSVHLLYQGDWPGGQSQLSTTEVYLLQDKGT